MGLTASRGQIGVRYGVNQENTKRLYNICTMLDQRRRRWADVVQMLYKCFVFAGNNSFLLMFCHNKSRHTN